MKNLRKSRYCFLFNRGNDFLAYTTATNSFYKINSYVAELIENVNICNDETNVNELETLHKLKLVTTEEEDDDVVNLLRMRYLVRSYSQDSLSITLLPTMSCNLKCPYCFEKNKKTCVMSHETCDKVVEFIKSHSCAKNLSLTWYGGEPMIGTNVIKYILSKINELEHIKLNFQGWLLTERCCQVKIFKFSANIR